MRRQLVLIGLLISVLTAGGVGAGGAEAQEPGDTITFLLPASGPYPDLLGDPMSKVIITGGPVTMIDTTGCAPGSHPVQNAVVVDSTMRTVERAEVIIVSQTEPVRPGTKLKFVTLDSTCVIAGTLTPYNKYNGTVE